MIFTKEQTEFLLEEFGLQIPANQNFFMTFEDWEDLKEKVWMIEADEARPDGSLNKRGRIAVEICDKFYQE